MLNWGYDGENVQREALQDDSVRFGSNDLPWLTEANLFLFPPCSWMGQELRI